jgi:hypothetical protein
MRRWRIVRRGLGIGEGDEFLVLMRRVGASRQAQVTTQERQGSLN